MEREQRVKVCFEDGRRETHAAARALAPMRAPLHPVLQLQQSFGNQAVTSLLRRRTIQAKSAARKPGSLNEHRADRETRVPDSAIGGGVLLAPRCAYGFRKVREYTGSVPRQAAGTLPGRGVGPGSHISAAPNASLSRARRVKRIIADNVSHGLKRGGAARIQKLENKSKTIQELGMEVVTYADGRIEATINQSWTEESGIGSTVIGMARMTGSSEEALIDELVATGAYRDEEQVRSGFIVGTRVVVKDGEVQEISVRGRVYKSGGKQQTDFEDFLDEGVEIFKKANFGLCGGGRVGRDPDDGYDAQYWVEEKRGRIIRATISAWDAMDMLVRYIGEDIPKAGGGTTKWSFDCFEATLILRLYAIWRTTDRDEFNAKYQPLRFGFHALTDTGLSKAFHSDGPGLQAYRIEGDYDNGVWTNYREVPVAKSMETLAIEAPIGALIAFSSQELRDWCAADPSPGYCAYQNENTIKLGPDRYFAHPFGAVTSGIIYRELAEAAGAIPSMGYYRKNIFISAIRYPR